VNHRDHVFLLQDGVPGPGGVWADFGAGRGAFTLALAELLGREGEIYAVDQDGNALHQLMRAMASRFPEVALHVVNDDFTQPLKLPPLAGIVMANALHYIRHKEPVVRLLRSYLVPGGRFLLVEYNVERGNHWVPFPISFDAWKMAADRAGFERTVLLAKIPSSFLGEFFAAVSW
jgi:ubiquinone/menaquinone biosynthesis C-methylase UbiE